jgi:hypothetical protein
MTRLAAGPRTAGAPPPGGPLLSRRQFLWCSAALGAGAAVGLPWAAARPLGLGFIGLGGLGGLRSDGSHGSDGRDGSHGSDGSPAARLAAHCRGLQGIRVAALCDRDPRVLRRLLAQGWQADLMTLDPRRLLSDPAVDAVVLAAAPAEQMALAAAACKAGKDVFLLRRLPLDVAGLRPLALLAERQAVQVHVARATRYALARSAACQRVGAAADPPWSARVETRLRSPGPLGAADLMAELVEEADFAEAMLGGEVVRAIALGGAGCLPGRWLERRLHLDLADESGARRTLSLLLTVERGAAAGKMSRLAIRGNRGTVSLAAVPVAPFDPLDLEAFLAAARSREPGPGLTLRRLLHLSERILATLPP